MVESPTFSKAYAALDGEALTAKIRAAADTLETALSTPSVKPRDLAAFVRLVDEVVAPLDEIYDAGQRLGRLFVWADSAQSKARATLELQGKFRDFTGSSSFEHAINCAERHVVGARAWLEVVDAGEPRGVDVIKRFEAAYGEAEAERRRTLGRYR